MHIHSLAIIEERRSTFRHEADKFSRLIETIACLKQGVSVFETSELEVLCSFEWRSNLYTTCMCVMQWLSVWELLWNVLAY